MLFEERLAALDAKAVTTLAKAKCLPLHRIHDLRILLFKSMMFIIVVVFIAIVVLTNIDDLSLVANGAQIDQNTPFFLFNFLSDVFFNN